MGKIDEEIQLAVPTLLIVAMFKVIEPLLSAASFFPFPGPKAVELN